MKNLSEIFYNEFKSMMKYRKAGSNITINTLPIPESIKPNVVEKKIVLLRGIREEYYSRLNFTGKRHELCTLIGKHKISKKKYMPDGKVRLDAYNQIMREDVVVPRECVAIISSIMIGVKNSYNPKEKFSYVDYSDNGVSKRYIYIVPREYVHLVNLCALVLSQNKMRSYYTCIEVCLTDGSIVYLSVIPFKPSTTATNRPYRVLRVEPTANFDKYIESILVFWELSGIMFDRSLTALEEPVNGIKNCGVCHMVQTIDTYELYDREKTLVIEDYEEV